MLIFWCLLEAGPDGSGLQHSPGLLSPAEQQRAERMRFPKRQAEWLLGRLAAKRLLVSTQPEYAHISLAGIEVENEHEGQPYYRIDGQRCRFSLSLSHSGGLALAAIAPAGVLVGIDIERVEPRTQAFFEDYFTAAEMQQLSALPTDVRDAGITLVWSAKEAVLKAWGKGLRLDTRTIEIDLPERLTDFGIVGNGWQAMGVNARKEGMPVCMLLWQPYREYIITLAHTAGADARIEQVAL